MRFKSLLTVALLWYSIQALSQNVPPDAEVAETRWQIGIGISPDYCNRTLFNDDDSEVASMIIDMRNKSESGKIGLTSGLSVSYKINKHFGVETGLQYSNKGYQFKMTDLFFGDQIDPRYDFPYDSTSYMAPARVKLIYSYHYLDVPFRLFFITGEKRLKFIAGLGVTTNIFLKATQTSISEYEDGEKEQHTYNQQFDYKPVSLSPTLSAGIAYKINTAFDLRLEPTFRYGVLKINDGRITTNLWSAGLNFSLFYRL